MFAAILLLWTAGDLLDFGLCVHGRERLGSSGPAALDTPLSESDASPVPASDDCFCCSHRVEAGVSFCLTLGGTATWAVPDAQPGRPLLSSAPLDHPPSA